MSNAACRINGTNAISTPISGVAGLRPCKILWVQERWPGFVRQAELSIVLCLAGKDPVHDISAVHDHRADLLAVDRFCVVVLL